MPFAVTVYNSLLYISMEATAAEKSRGFSTADKCEEFQIDFKWEKTSAAI